MKGRMSDPITAKRNRRGSIPGRCLFVVFLVLHVCAGGVFAATNHASATPTATLPAETVPDYSLDPESIMSLTMANSARIKAAKNKLESAEFNYKLFESRYTQFSPFKMDSEVQRDRDNEYEGQTSVGVEKEYFDGSSLSASVGTRNIWGESQPNESAQFFETKVQFPLFSSNTKLTRMIERTFEENELYSAQLDYVNAIRDTIKKSLEQYYDYIPRSQILQAHRAYKENLVQLKDSASLNGRAADRQLLEGEINSLTSKIQGWEIEVQSLLIEMERWIGVANFDQFAVDLIGLDFDLPGYFGEFYVMAPFDEILKKTIENDTELMVLELVEINAIEKKRLAQKGKWDMFLTVAGRYNFNERVGGLEPEDYYEVGSGITIKRFDRMVLLNTIRKSDADILYIKRTIEDREIEMSAGITQKKVTLLTTKDRVLSSRISLDSWEQIHELKKGEFIKGTETADIYIQSFRSLMDAMEAALRQENEYLDTVRDFDYICGTYFEHLGIKAY